MEYEIDLGDAQTISAVSASFFQNTGKWIFMAEKVHFELLDENKEIVATEVLEPDATYEVKGTIIEDIVANFENLSARYIRLHAKNIKTLPDWHPGAGEKAWIFVDEVIVE